MEVKITPKIISEEEKVVSYDNRRGDIHIGWTREQLFEYFKQKREQYAREALIPERRGGFHE